MIPHFQAGFEQNEHAVGRSEKLETFKLERLFMDFILYFTFLSFGLNHFPFFIL